MSLIEQLNSIDQDLESQVKDVISIDQLTELKESFFGKKDALAKSCKAFVMPPTKKNHWLANA